jgi:hypothetical protein
LLTVGGVNGHEFEKAQFTQTDPAPLGAGSTFERSYVYAYDNPLKSVDPNVKRGVAKGEPEATISAGPEIERACTHGQVNFRSTCLFAQLVGSTRPGSLDDLTLGSTGSIGSLLETYGFESFAEGLVSTFAVKLFHYEGPGNHGIRRSTLTRFAFTATGQWLGDGTKPDPSVGLEQQTVRYQLKMSSGTTYIHNQPWQVPTLYPAPRPRSALVAFDGPAGWNKLLRGQWVEYSNFPLVISG